MACCRHTQVSCQRLGKKWETTFPTRDGFQAAVAGQGQVHFFFFFFSIFFFFRGLDRGGGWGGGGALVIRSGMHRNGGVNVEMDKG